MSGPARPGRSARVARTVSVLVAFAFVVTTVAAGTPGGASDDPAGVPEAAAAAEPRPTVAVSNAFGIQQAQPAGKGIRIAVKNGWTEHGASGQWNVNCLGVWGPGSRWVLAVTTRYPIGNGLDYGADVCRRVTTALFPLVKTG